VRRTFGRPARSASRRKPSITRSGLVQLHWSRSVMTKQPLPVLIEDTTTNTNKRRIPRWFARLGLSPLVTQLILRDKMATLLQNHKPGAQKCPGRSVPLTIAEWNQVFNNFIFLKKVL